MVHINLTFVFCPRLGPSRSTSGERKSGCHCSPGSVGAEACSGKYPAQLQEKAKYSFLFRLAVIDSAPGHTVNSPGGYDSHTCSQEKSLYISSCTTTGSFESMASKRVEMISGTGQEPRVQMS